MQPGPRAIATAKIVHDFNQEVQFDLLFWKHLVVCHLVDTCIRFSVGGLTKSRETTDVLEVITQVWIRVFSPMKRLVSDHEGALDSDVGRTWADRWSIQLVLRPRGSHARMIEKHNDLLQPFPA